MPRPTLIQAVFRKPTRSYANPYAPSPWADDPEPEEDEAYDRPASRYSSRVDDGVFLGFRETPEAGPSSLQGRQARRVRSTVSFDQEQAYHGGSGIGMATRFPKAVRQVNSSVALRSGVRLEEVEDGPSRAPMVKKKTKKKGVRRERTDSIGEGSVVSSRADARSAVSSATVKRKGAKAKVHQMEYNDSPVSSRGSSRSIDDEGQASARPPSRAVIPNGILPVRSSPASTPPTVTLHPAAEALAAKARPKVSVVQRNVGIGTAPLTPPSSVRSSADSLKATTAQTAAQNPPANAQTPSSLLGQAVTASPQRTTPLRTVPHATAVPVPRLDPDTSAEDEAFFSAGESPQKVMASTATIIAPPPSLSPSRAMPTLGPPSFSVQPPTPAPIHETDDSPFHSEPASSASSLHQRDKGHLQEPVTFGGLRATSSENTTQPVLQEDDTRSASSEVGSDGEEESQGAGMSAAGMRGRHSRTTSFSAAQNNVDQSRSRSRPSSVARSNGAESVDGRLSRQSTSRHNMRPSIEEYMAQRHHTAAPSEASFGGRSVKEGSVRGSVSGFGKGGWAAAAASARPTTSPTMYMPSSGQDGWADFHPPPRQSRFTPLPAASQPMTFDRLVLGHQLGSASASGSAVTSERGLQVPRQPVADGGSAPSSYSQSSDEEDDLPKPSRSYAKSSASGTPDLSRVGDPFQNYTSRGEDYASGRPPSRSDCQPMSHWSVPPVPPPKNPSRRLSVQTSPNISNSRSPSLAYGHDGGSEAASPSFSSSTFPERQASAMTTRPMSPASPRTTTPSARIGFETPSFLNPDVLTLLPEMSLEDSARLYARPAPSESGRSKRASWQDPPRRANSVFGMSRLSRSEVGDGDEVDEEAPGLKRRAKSSIGYHRSEYEGVSDEDGVPGPQPMRSKSSIGLRRPESKWEGSSYGEGVLMGSNGIAESVSGYTNLVLPAGAYTPLNPAKATNELNTRILGLPHASMASITLSTSAHRLPMTPMHLRGGLPPPVDFSNHLKPPTKVGDSQLLVHVYAVAVDALDVDTIEEKGKGDVGKWVPGRSFVGRCLSVGGHEKDIVRGDIVIGLVDIRKSGALSEYILVDRRRLARAPHPTSLSLEQLAVLPLHGIRAARALRVPLNRLSRALIMDAHKGVAALVCQEISRSGVHVTAIIAGGENHHEAQYRSMEHGARGVLTGTPAAVMNNLEEEKWDYVLDTVGGERTYWTARRILRDGAKLVSLVPAEVNMPLPAQAASKPTGFKTLRAAFRSSRKESKHVSFQYVPPAGSGEAEVDASGVDVRDMLEERCMGYFRPVVGRVWAFEKGMEAFRGEREEVEVVRLIN